MDVIEIGKKIKKARGDEYTLDDIASKVGVAKSTIQRYERGLIANPKLPVLQSIANALGVNPAWLVGKSEDMYLPDYSIEAERKCDASLLKIIEYYNCLNNLGRSKAVERMEELSQISSYSSENEQSVSNQNVHEAHGK